MALDTNAIAGGAVTATEIKAAYEPLNSKADGFEYCVLDFVNRILELAGVDDKATFTRSMIVNVTESVQVVLQAAPYLDSEYVTRKILSILGDSDQAEKVLERMDMEDMGRFQEPNEPTEPQPAEGDDVE